MDKINEILIQTFKLNAEEVAKNLSMKQVNRWDSITHMDLIVNIEEAFGIQISGDDIAEMTTFDSIREIVSKYKIQ